MILFKLLYRGINLFLSIIGISKKVDFIIVGTQKGGTTSLYHILNQHKKLKGSYPKETHFFDIVKINKLYYHYYNSYFPLLFPSSRNSLLYEATPSYLYSKDCAQKIFDYNNKMKIIILLRNPVERLISAWNMYHYKCKEGEYSFLYDERDLKEIINSELKTYKTDDFHTNNKGYIKRGLYFEQIKRYIDLFGKKNVLILENKDLLNVFSPTIKKIEVFLNIPCEELKNVFVNKSQTKIKHVFEEERKILKEFYREPNEKLFEYLGYRYDWND